MKRASRQEVADALKTSLIGTKYEDDSAWCVDILRAEVLALRRELARERKTSALWRRDAARKAARQSKEG